MNRPSEQAKKEFRAWLKENAFDLPLIAWGDLHDWVAIAYAEHRMKNAVNRTLDEALNSGDGSYKP